MNSDYRISTNKTEMDIDAIHAYLTNSYWGKGISRDVVARAIQGSLCFGMFHNDDQIGFARMVTDKATFGYLADVYILPAHQSKGLGKKLVEAVLQHPELQGLRRIMLATKDAHSLYRSYGFTELSEPQRFMQKWNPNIYKTQSDS